MNFSDIITDKIDLLKVNTSVRMHAQHGGINIHLIGLKGTFAEVAVTQAVPLDGRVLTDDELTTIARRDVEGPIERAGYHVAFLTKTLNVSNQ